MPFPVISGIFGGFVSFRFPGPFIAPPRTRRPSTPPRPGRATGPGADQ